MVLRLASSTEAESLLGKPGRERLSKLSMQLALLFKSGTIGWQTFYETTEVLRDWMADGSIMEISSIKAAGDLKLPVVELTTVPCK